MTEFYDKLTELLQSHSKLAIATVVVSKGSTPREVGAKMVVLANGDTYETIGGGKLELMVTQDAVRALESGESVLKEYTLRDNSDESDESDGIGAMCGGDATVFIEVLTHGEQLLILGGGHIGLALYRLAIETGFSVIIVDERPEFASEERFPRAEQVMNCKINDQRVKKVVDKDTYIVILTHSHEQDKLAVKSLIDQEFKYMGMIGSRTKVKKIFSELKTEGVSKQKLENVFTPIGLDIAAETPAEIAVSILAELVQVRRTGTQSKISMRKQKLGS